MESSLEIRTRIFHITSKYTASLIRFPSVERLEVSLFSAIKCFYNKCCPSVTLLVNIKIELSNNFCEFFDSLLDQ